MVTAATNDLRFRQLLEPILPEASRIQLTPNGSLQVSLQFANLALQHEFLLSKWHALDKPQSFNPEVAPLKPAPSVGNPDLR